jgi:uncharacterized protein
MSSYKTPGVYIEEINSLPPAIAPVSTAIPVFIGRCVHQPGTDSLIGAPVRITSMLDYVAKFKAPEEKFEYKIAYDLTTKTATSISTISNLVFSITDETGVNVSPKSLMYYALQMYFGNGGGPCYVCSVGDISTLDTAMPANYTNAFLTLKAFDEPTLLVCTDLTLPNSGVTATDIQNDMLRHCEIMQDRFAVLDVMNAVPSATVTPDTLITNFRTSVGNTPEQRMYGASYYPYLLTTLRYAYSLTGANSVKIKVAISSYSDNGTTITPAAGSATPVVTTNDLGSDYIKKNWSSYYSKIMDRLRMAFVVLPPSPAVAGVYAMTDNTRGVWKAPANVNLNMVQNPMLNITQDFNDNLNSMGDGKSVNAIRKFARKGIKIWGARTLNANDLNWRFVNVRREVIVIETSIRRALQSMVFEPNTANTWVKAKAMVENFLTLIWRQGGLAGAKAEDAFQVNIGINSTMTAEDIAMGIMILEVTLVPPRPAEVIVLRVSQKLQVS